MDFLEILAEAVIDTLKLVPFLFLTVLFMEYVEHRAGDKLAHSLQKAGKFGPAAGAALGCIPQCGFSAAAAQLFNGGFISAGTLVAVFLSTSDEAIPVLIGEPGGWKAVGLLIAAKVVIALITGYVLDALWRGGRASESRETTPAHDAECHEASGNFLRAALLRSLSILAFLFLATLLLGLVIVWIGEDALAALLLPGPFQPLLAALIGLIPNCAASVLLTQLYLSGMLTFGSAVAGLCSAAGIGMLVLFRGKRRLRLYAVILAVTFGSAVLFGTLLQLIG